MGSYQSKIEAIKVHSLGQSLIYCFNYEEVTHSGNITLTTMNLKFPGLWFFKHLFSVYIASCKIRVFLFLSPALSGLFYLPTFTHLFNLPNLYLSRLRPSSRTASRFTSYKEAFLVPLTFTLNFHNLNSSESVIFSSSCTTYYLYHSCGIYIPFPFFIAVNSS